MKAESFDRYKLLVPNKGGLLISSLSVLRNGLTAAAPVKMHSRLQELKKEEETLLKIKVMLQDQLNRLKVRLGGVQSAECVWIYVHYIYFVFQFEEGALKSIINAQTEGASQRSTETEVSFIRGISC